MTNQILTIDDVASIERVPLAERLPGTTGYEALAAAAARGPDRVAITALEPGAPLEPPREVTFGELLEEVNRTGNMLRSRGLQADEAVTHLLPLVPEVFSLTIAAETVGIVNPVNPMLDVEHIESITRAAGTRVLATPGKALNQEIFAKAWRIAAANPAIHTVYVLGGSDECDGKRFLPLEASIAAYNGAEIEGGAGGSLEDTVAYYHTGGTTGVPKLAPHSQRMRLGQTISTGMMMGYRETDNVILGLPPFHVAGAIILGLIPLFNGARVLLLSPSGYRDEVAVRAFWKIIEQRQVTVLVAVPTVFSALQNVPVGGADLSSLRVVMTGGSAVPTQMLQTVSEQLGREVAQGFGMTEIGGMGLIQTRPGPGSRGSTGIRGPYIEVKIGMQNVDGTVQGEAATDEIGVLCFRGPCVMSGYAGDIAREETFTADGWLNTGDLARMDAAGEVWITGRAKDLIIRGGHNIDPMIIEDVLQGHPAVSLTAAVGKPDAYAGELPVAYVQLLPGATISAEELNEYARLHITERAAAPVEVIVMQEMPKTGIDKIFKPALRLDAVRRAFEEAIAANPEVRVEASVEARNQPMAGIMADVTLKGAQCAEQESLVRSALGRFATPFRVQWAVGP